MANLPPYLGGYYSKRPDGWPHLNYRKCDNAGEKIAAAESYPGAVRHDLLLTSQAIGRLIGPRGANFRRVKLETGCELFILDKEPPPGES